MRSPAPSQKDFWGPRTLLSMSAKDLRGWCRGSRWQPCSTMPSRSSAGNLCRTDAAEAASKGYIHLLTVGERIGDFAQIDRAIPGDLRGRTRSLSGLSVKTSGPIGPSGMEALENGCVDHRLTTC